MHAAARAQVDVWHAYVEGIYSDEPSGRIQSKATVAEKYLRGYQISDQTGAVRFSTIYPGWYFGCTIHIHFKVRSRPARERQAYESPRSSSSTTRSTTSCSRSRPATREQQRA